MSVINSRPGRIADGKPVELSTVNRLCKAMMITPVDERDWEE